MVPVLFWHLSIVKTRLLLLICQLKSVGGTAATCLAISPLNLTMPAERATWCSCQSGRELDLPLGILSLFQLRGKKQHKTTVVTAVRVLINYILKRKIFSPRSACVALHFERNVRTKCGFNYVMPLKNHFRKENEITYSAVQQPFYSV